ARICIRSARHLVSPTFQARMHTMEEASAQLLPEGASVLGNQDRFTYMRHGFQYHLPYVKNIDDLEDYIHHYHIQYAIFDTAALAGSPSAFDHQVLLHPERWPPGWKNVRTLFPDRDPAYIVKLDEASP